MNKKNGIILAALGVVFGDIGTSPLYALKECFNPEHGIELSASNILGISSLIFWSLNLVIIFKYLFFILKANNNGEGGIMALLSLLKNKKNNRKLSFTIILGIFGTALLYGDGIITPAISVLSAVEGINQLTPNLNNYIIPITIAILFVLFYFQKNGTEKIGSFFGPILFIWFGALFVTGLYWIFKNPLILQAINPYYSFLFFKNNGEIGFLILGSVVLVVTGGEALYADLGHFGIDSIKKAWFWIVYPSLVTNYFGQGALLLSFGKSVVDNPFFNLVNEWLLYPLIILSTIAAIIASQALITGAYSLTQQAMSLGYFPRMTIKYTSRFSQGQIYIRTVNNLLMIGCILLVLFLKESSKLASAYGIAVTGTMMLTSILFFYVSKETLGYSRLKSFILVSIFLIFDIAFFGANVIKIFSGGWIPLVIGAFIFWLMITWKKGKDYVFEYIKSSSESLDSFIKRIDSSKVYRNPGTAIFMTINKEIAPYSLVNNLKHNNVIHEKVAILTVLTENLPEVSAENKVVVQKLESNFYRLIAKYGFMEKPDVQEILMLAKKQGFEASIDETSFFLGKEFIVPIKNRNMFYISKKLFKIMTSNSQSAMDFYKIPKERVIEIGGQVKI